MKQLTLKELDFARSRRWLLAAKTKRKSDPVFCFIATWIAFNHFYSTYASAHAISFAAWSQANASGSPGDGAQWRYLVSVSEFEIVFRTFKSGNPALFNTRLDLPVINMLNQKAVPPTVVGATKLHALSQQELFAVVYQIRNNLFHGDKDPTKSKRDAQLCKFVSAFMLPFVSTLVTATHGEVCNVNDVKQNKQRELVSALTKPM